MSESIGILGAGRMGIGLARAFMRAGHTVVLGSRDPDQSLLKLADRLDMPGGAIALATYREAIQNAEIVVVAVPFVAAGALLDTLRDAIASKIVIDITNPFGAIQPGSSAPEEHAKLLPPGTPLVAAFKTTTSTNLEPVERGGILHDVFICGDDESAKARVSTLITEIGFRPVDCGGLIAGRVLDPMVPLLLEIDTRYGNNHHSAWKFLP